jgi:hypothetical protein
VWYRDKEFAIVSCFKFRYPEWVEIEPSEWVQKWAAVFLLDKERKEDDCVYKSLMEKNGVLSGNDFEQIGRWKVGCLLKKDGKEHGMWKPKTSAAYDVWMQARRNPPERPTNDGTDKVFARQFLITWSEKTFEMKVKGGKEKGKRFGLSFATALLHFISVGRFPIYDDLVREALRRLGSQLPSNMTVDAYLEKFCPLFSSIAPECGLSQGIDDLRKLDNALRCFGGAKVLISKIDEPGRRSANYGAPAQT